MMVASSHSQLHRGVYSVRGFCSVPARASASARPPARALVERTVQALCRNAWVASVVHYYTRSLHTFPAEREEPQMSRIRCVSCQMSVCSCEPWRVWVELRYSAVLVKPPFPLSHPSCPLSVLTWNQIHGLCIRRVCSQSVSCF